MAKRIKNERELMERVIKMLPDGIPASAIESVEYDPYDGDETPDSYWVYLNDGFICPPMECKTIHEDYLNQLASMVGTIRRWDDDPDLTEHRGYTEHEEETAQSAEEQPNTGKEDSTMKNIITGHIHAQSIEEAWSFSRSLRKRDC